MNERVMQEIQEDRLTTTINVELDQLVTEGLLEMGITPDGEALYWPTRRGCQVLGMELDTESETSMPA